MTKNFIESHEAEQIVRSVEAAADDVRIVERGTANVVGIADKKRVYKFPRDARANAWQQYESALLRRLDGQLTLAIPEVLEEHTNPDFVITSYIDGEHRTEDDLRQLPDKVLRQIVSQLLAFSGELNAAVTPQIVTELEAKYVSAYPGLRIWRIYLADALLKTNFPDQPWLEQLAREHFAKWEKITANSSLPHIVVHDDLWAGNILFNHEQRVSGILDFGDTTVGTIAQELRQLLRIDENALDIAIDEHRKLTETDINKDEVWAWAIGQELAAYCRWLAEGQTDRQSFLRAQKHLREWLPDFQG